MADTTLTSLTSDQAEAAVAAFLLALADRNWTGGDPRVRDIGRCNFLNSNVVSIAAYELAGAQAATQTGEGSAYAPIALGDAKYSCTVVKYTHANTPTDIARIIKGGVFSPQNFALNALMIGAIQLTKLLATAGAGFTATAGPGSGIDADIPSILAGVGKLGTLNPDLSLGAAGWLHSQQWADLLVDSAATGGMQANQDPEIFDLKPGGQGRLWGVDWTVSNHVPTANAGADRAGCIFAANALLYAGGMVPVDTDGQVSMDFTLYERDRDALSGKTSHVTHVYLGVSKGLEAGVTFISDA